MDNKDFNTRAFLENSFLLENIQGGIVYSDFNPPFALRYATEGMAQLTGYTQEELLGMEQMDIVWEEDIPGLIEDVGRQFSVGDTFTVEYRLKRKDGSYIYVLDRAKAVEHEDGKKYIHCLLTDITDLKQMEQALKLSQEKYKLAIQQSGNVILDYNLFTKELNFSENYEQLFGTAPPGGVLSEIIESGWIKSSYMQSFAEVFETALVEKRPAGIELQICTAPDTYVWGAIHLSPVCTPSGMTYAIAGCLQNIDDHKKEVARLRERSQKDGLTNIYNRVTMEELINKRLSDSDALGNAALLIMDIDYFKRINDENGHAFGDDILISLTEEVKQILPKNALFGRLGGDEFLIFVEAIGSLGELEALAQAIVERVRNRFRDNTPTVTVSIGAARCSAKWGDFKSLYKCADSSLYETKDLGRNRYTIYNT